MSVVRLTWLLALPGLLGGVAHAAELDAARNDAMNVTSSLEQRPCPSLGDRKYLRGMTDPQQLGSAAERERAYEDGALQQIQQIQRDPKLGQDQRIELQSLASWSIAASMGNWSLLAVAQQALADPLIVAGRPHPVAFIEGARDRLLRTVSSNLLSADAASAIRRQAAVLDRCGKGFSADVFKLNQPQFDAAVDAAASAADLGRLEQQYRMQDATAAGVGLDSADKLSARRTAVLEMERAARENATAASAAEAAKRQAELRAKLPGYLVVAQRFADAARRSDEQAALAELSPNVVMTTPNGNYRGINQVAAAVRQQSASGQGGTLGTPRIDGNRIVANGRAAGYQILTTFSFDRDSHISRIDISL